MKMKGKLGKLLGSSLLFSVVAVSLSVTPAYASDYTGKVIYQVVTDRFYDGNTSNDNPSSSPNLFSANHSNWKLYWGGDWQGIADKIPYLANMGVGAIWISPPYQNINVPAVYNGVDEAGYHGYWGMDFMVPEPHFGDWSAFDNLVKTAHSYGIKVIIDYAPNHTNPNDTGAYGALYDNGTKLADYQNDPNGYFHHNGSISNYNNLYDVEYKNLFDLADLSQGNPNVDQYLKSAIDTWMSHGVDGIRLDAVKHMPAGWLKTFANHVYTNHNTFIFGEWADDSSATLWPEEVKFANTTGISLLNFNLNNAIRSVFANNANMSQLNDAINQDATEFTYPNQLVNFFDSHDEPRFLSVNNNKNLFNDALVFELNAQGIPDIYYGDEQYLHNDTNGGGDPYNRPMMNSWSETTTPYKITQDLSNLRKQNPALRFGTSTQRWMNNDVYVYERKFYNSVVLTAVNKSTTTSYNITGLDTALPSGTYQDVLGGLMGGQSLTVNSGSSGNNPANAFTLGPNQAAVWSYTSAPSKPEVGNVDPVNGQAGNTITIAGDGFGSTQGTVNFGSTPAQVVSWSNTSIQVKVPSVTPGNQNISVVTSSGTSNGIVFSVLSGKQVPVNFKVTNAYPTSYGDNIYLSGNTPELGNWSTNTGLGTNTTTSAWGPLLDPNNPTWFSMASVPANTNLQFKFFDLQAGGSVVWENGSNHTYTTPTSTESDVTVNWQY
ncbi:alpha-amylase family glycosyl hydrolase [Alicyclobacillus sp. SO9]|uniref:alpha-amylase family glycosyl hydrolase n=1 Tax=Alicyclobacillus sp. SO9 TaxID=2665646 RepID=UPI0018E7D214|nr:alpha-amylase family glycosyl hydrolase [Alicyclobacillus sp. SO9]QQE79266.1 IPT/TIG domain-containing protein [Alicyclobacillus sp. SO9]